MRRAFISGLCLALGLACRPLLPPVLPPGSLTPEEIGLCTLPRPGGPFRVIHALDISLPFGQQSAVMGITISDPETGRLRATLLSLEGLVLFDATSAGGAVTVHRALPPLDAPAFAPNLITDVGFLFGPDHPADGITAFRRNGGAVCRRISGGAEIRETVSDGSGGWILRQYNERGKLVREAAASGPVSPEGFFRKMRLEVRPGRGDYSLGLELVEGELIEPSDSLFEP